MKSLEKEIRAVIPSVSTGSHFLGRSAKDPSELMKMFYMGESYLSLGI